MVSLDGLHCIGVSRVENKLKTKMTLTEIPLHGVNELPDPDFSLSGMTPLKLH